MLPSNQVTTTVVEYGVERRNPAAGIVRDAITRLHGFLVPVLHGADGMDETTFHGYADTVQSFKGAASPAGNAITYRDGGSGEISDALVSGPMGDPARKVFAARLRRRLA